MNEKMREMASKGELSEASYKKLVDELGRTKEEAGAPLFEVAFIVNTVSAYSFTDANTDEECIGQLQTSEKHTCVMRGVKGAGWKNSGHFLAGRLLLDDGGKLFTIYKPGLQFEVGKVDPSSFTIYTILEIKPFSA